MKHFVFMLLFINTVYAQAIFKYVKGNVVKSLYDNQEVIIKTGDTLEEDETVVLNEGAQIVLKIENHSVQRIEGPAKFTLESLVYNYEDSDEIEKPASILMETGTFFIKVLKKSDNESMLVKTKSTTFGIRGTEFLLDVPENNDVLLTLNEGAIEVSNNDQVDIVEKGGSLFIENDTTFKTLRDPELRKNINWKFEKLDEESSDQFRKYRKKNRERLREKLQKWNRDDLKWSRFKKQRSEKLQSWKEKVKDLKQNKKLERSEMRKKLRKENREKMRTQNKETSKERRENLRQKKIDELKKRKLNNPNEFINEQERRRLRQNARERMLEKRREFAPKPITAPTGSTSEQ